MQQLTLAGTELERHHCLPKVDCRYNGAAESKYRTADGSCNNLRHPQWGQSNTAMERLAPTAYADGLNAPRGWIAVGDGSKQDPGWASAAQSDSGSYLPSARVVSSHLANDVNLEERRFSLLLMQWGQFIDHDLTLAASTRRKFVVVYYKLRTLTSEMFSSQRRRFGVLRKSSTKQSQRSVRRPFAERKPTTSTVGGRRTGRE